MKNIVVILAAGSGVRSGFNTPKQLVKLAGRPVVSHAIKPFEVSSFIDEIAIVTSPDSYTEIEALVHKEGYKKVKKIILGGRERWESSWAAISAYRNESSNEELNLIFHDAVRPLVDEFIVERVVKALTENSCVDVVINTVDTIVEVDDSNNYIGRILDRSKLRNGQTPQGFRYNVIKKAYEKAIEDPNKVFTDDCGIVMKYLPEEKIYLVEGSSYNHKLTYNEDLAILDKLFQMKRNLVTTSNLDEGFSKCLEGLKDKVVVIFGGTSGIGEEIQNILQNAEVKSYPISRKTGCDIASIESVEAALKEINAKEGRIDFIINTAGILPKQSLALMDYKDIHNSIAINYLGAVNIAYAGFQYLSQSSGGLLLFTSSSYTYGRAFYSLYSSSKAAIVNLVQALAEEWGDFGVNVNCVSPERTLTPMRIAAFGKEDPMTLLSAVDVAKASIKILCMEETGLVIDVKRQP
ncbi:MAG: bifunctional cytidylyltransferase/SDR family oxidoreductase [Bdellovibrionaceae bacterium]|nr:bifunctional cytidylyltransferase/SDR family oxidoreductase [Pseudobdellovibrionaceae bacterium]